MGRNPKQGLDYFQADVDMFQDRKIKRLLRAAGGKGFTVFIYLLTDIYRDQGYYYVWDEHSAFDISDELNFSEGVVEETVQACCTIGLFSQALFAAESVLTSESIQQRWLRIVKDAGRTITEIDPQILIEGGKPFFGGGKSNRSGGKPHKPPDKSNKEKERKEKNKTPDDARAREEPPDHVQGCPIPGQLQVEGFPKRYREFCEYLETEKKQTISVRRVESHFRRLIELKNKGNPPLAVMDQTMRSGNKDLYDLKDKRFKNKHNGPTDSDQIVRNTLEQTSKLTFEDA